MAAKTHQNDLSIAEVRQLCKEWVKVLRLADWRIRVRYAYRNELDNAQGRFEANSKKKMAVIVLQPFAFDGCLRDPLEMTLLHELVHLHLDPLTKTVRDEREDTALEQAVDALAYALFRAKYPKWADPDWNE